MDFDRHKMMHIISNMVGNAFKFTDEGEVKVLISEGEKEGIPMLRMDIIDTGIGIKDENKEKIFKRFYQADTMQSKVGQGTGIGLELVRDLLDLLGGSIELNSASGVGSYFKIFIPITNDAELIDIAEQDMAKVHVSELKRQSERIKGNDNSGPRLLIIADNPNLLHLLIGQLGDEYEIAAAEDGAAGVDLALEWLPDLIISDIMMLYKDGYQVVDELKNNALSSHIPIILLTARDDAQSKFSGLKRGADAYLTKPYDVEELKMRISNFLARRDRLIDRFSDGNLLKATKAESEIDLEEGFIIEVQALIDSNLENTDFGIQELCKALSISRTQLYNKLTGLSASRYIS
jgi:DNA-binding response OmpR family regulator